MNQAQAIAEQVETEEYALLLPAKSEELRHYLANDGLLSNEEITKALYDDSLTKKALREKVAAAEPTADKKLLDRLTNHLWDTHQSVKAAKHLLPAEGIDPTATYRLTITEGQPNRIEPKPQQARSQEQEAAPMPKVVIVNGNLIANFLHNYNLNRDLQLKIEKLPDQVQQVQSQQPEPVQQPLVTTVRESKPKPEPTPAQTLVTSPNVAKETTNTPQVPTQPANKVDQTNGITTGTPAQARPYQWEQVAGQLAAAGVTRQQLADSGQLTQLLSGQQTDSLAFDQKIGNRYVSLTGKIRVVDVNGQPVVRMQPIRDGSGQPSKITHSLSIPKQLRGYTFTPDDRANLLKTGELGNRVELIHPTTGQLYPAYIGADSKTRQLVITRQDQVKLPKSINGVTLTQTQRELIGEGKAVRLDGLTGQNGQTFSAFVQVSAAKRGLNISSIPANSVKQTTDLKTAADLNRPSHELRGTANSQSRATETNKAKKPQQTRRQEPAVADEISRGPRLR